MLRKRGENSHEELGPRFTALLCSIVGKTPYKGTGPIYILEPYYEP